MKKPTAKENYEKLIKVVEKSEAENKEDLLTFLNKQLDSMKKKAEKAKSKDDPLRDDIRKVLTDNYQSTDTILAEVLKITQVEDVTKAKVSARLTYLFKNNEIEKTTVKNAENKSVMGYKNLSESGSN